MQQGAMALTVMILSCCSWNNPRNQNVSLSNILIFHCHNHLQISAHLATLNTKRENGA